MPDLRITSGELGGRRIKGPGSGAEIRPTTERVREAIFSILGSVEGARVLDLYCGTGALGIEALSRGAAEATLVDTDPALASENVRSLGIGDRVEVARSDASRFLDRAPDGAFDLVLCDPPYGLPDPILSQLDPLIRRVLAPGGRVVLESGVKSSSAASRPDPDGASGLTIELPLVRERTYGETLVRVYESGGDA